MLDTLMLFEETLDYQTELAERLGLTNVQNLRPDPEDVKGADPTGTLHQYDTDACCDIRKVHAARPGARALSGDDLGAQALPVGDAGDARGVRGARGPAADQPAGGLERA